MTDCWYRFFVVICYYKPEIVRPASSANQKKIKNKIQIVNLYKHANQQIISPKNFGLIKNHGSILYLIAVPEVTMDFFSYFPLLHCTLLSSSPILRMK